VIGSGSDGYIDLIGNNASVTGNTRAYRFQSEDIASFDNEEARFCIRGMNDDDGASNSILPTTTRINYMYFEPRAKTNGSILDVIRVNPSSVDIDFNVLGDTDADLLYVDASADAVGISTSTPDTNVVLHVAGEVRLDSTTGTTASAGSQTLPSNPDGFITVNINGIVNYLIITNTIYINNKKY
jgi:hypothetical protein